MLVVLQRECVKRAFEYKVGVLMHLPFDTAGTGLVVCMTQLRNDVAEGGCV